jgi:hypothetical protein
MELSEETTHPAVEGKLLTQASGPDEQLLHAVAGWMWSKNGGNYGSQEFL